MSNPLIDKYFELYPEKKEEPKKEYLALSEEQMDIVSKYLTTPDKYSTVSVTNVNPNSVSTITGGVNPNSVSAITGGLHIKKLTSYDSFTGDDTFLDIAGKIQNGEAKVVSMNVNMEHFTKSYTFEVSVYT